MSSTAMDHPIVLTEDAGGAGTGLADLASALAAVKAVRPVLEAHQDWAEANRQLAPEAYRAMIDAGLGRLPLPETYGGGGLRPDELLTVWEALARIDPAAAWNLMMTSGNMQMVGPLPTEGLAEVFANGPPTIAGALNPPLTATRVAGGWLVSGGSPFASGCHHTPWYALGAIEVRDGEPVLDPDTGAPQPFVIVIPRGDATVIDSWHTIGMRGTGSATIEVEDLFVPDHRTWQLSQLASPHASFDHLYLRMWPMVQVHGESIVSVGVAASAVDALVELAGTKTASYTTAALADRELIQYQAGRARALVDAARAYLHTACRAAYEEATTAPRLSDQTKMSMQLAGCFAAEACAESVRLVHDAAGTSGIRLEAPFERHLRDALTLSQHASKASSRYASAGRLLFGLPNDWIFLSF